MTTARRWHSSNGIEDAGAESADFVKAPEPTAAADASDPLVGVALAGELDGAALRLSGSKSPPSRTLAACRAQAPSVSSIL